MSKQGNFNNKTKATLTISQKLETIRRAGTGELKERLWLHTTLHQLPVIQKDQL
jgi:hypothetical protein